MKSCIAVMLLLLAPLVASAQTVEEALLFRDRDATEKWLAEHHIPALGIGFVEAGQIREVVVYGKNAAGESNADDTIFNVASLTKPITAMVALKLVNAGQWKLDEPLAGYWTDPDVADDPRSKMLTTRHILSHQSGFPNWRRDSVDGKLSFAFSPGEKYQYSGEGMEYLRRALESKFHVTLDRLASDLIFEPLAMTDTHFYWDDSMEEARFAREYKADGSLYASKKTMSANAADDLLTTVADYSKFMLHIMNGAGLSAALYQEMRGNAVRINANK